MGLVTDPHAHTSRTHSQWVAGPGRTPQGRAVGRERAPNPGCPTRRQEAPPPRAPSCRSTSRKASSQEHALWVGGEPLHPHHPHPQLVGSGPRRHAPRTGDRVLESAQPQTPRMQARGAPTGALVLPKQRAKPAR